MTPEKAKQLADYLLEWLVKRNGGELAPAFGDMRVRDLDRMASELELILEHEGRPPNWIEDSMNARRQ